MACYSILDIAKTHSSSQNQFEIKMCIVQYKDDESLLILVSYMYVLL